MDWTASPALRALRQAQAVAACARRTGCGPDEAADVLAERAAAGEGRERGAVSRRAVLGGAGAAAFASAVPAAWLSPPRAAASRDQRVVIIGSGIAGLGCAYRLWAGHGIRSEIYEYNASQPGGRISTLRNFFAAGQYAEEHAEFISSEHTATRLLAAHLGLVLDNMYRYPPHTHPND